MKYPVSRPQLLSSVGTTLRTLTITALPGAPAAALLPQNGSLLTINDCTVFTTAADSNAIWSAPLSALVIGSTIHVPATTSAGLCVSAVPGGVAISVDFG